MSGWYTSPAKVRPLRTNTTRKFGKQSCCFERFLAKNCRIGDELPRQCRSLSVRVSHRAEGEGVEFVSISNDIFAVVLTNVPHKISCRAVPRTPRSFARTIRCQLYEPEHALQRFHTGIARCCRCSSDRPVPAAQVLRTASRLKSMSKAGEHLLPLARAKHLHAFEQRASLVLRPG
jgi:hypothetical protein